MLYFSLSNVRLREITLLSVIAVQYCVKVKIT